MRKPIPEYLIAAKFIVLFCILDLIGGCVNAPKLVQDTLEPDYESYAKQVFIHQNQVLDELMYLSESTLSDSENEILLEAERKLQDACGLLNEYAVNNIDGISMSWYFKNQVKNSVARCDETIEQIEIIMDSLPTLIHNPQY